LLLGMPAQVALQGKVQQVRGRVGAANGLAALSVDRGFDRHADLELSLAEMAGVEDQTPLALGVHHVELEPGTGDLADIAHLAAPFAIEGSLIEHHQHGLFVADFVERFDQLWIHSQTPIKGLYLTGADTLTAGVGGALMGGVMTATCMLGWQGYKVGKLLKNWNPQSAGNPAGNSATA